MSALPSRDRIDRPYRAEYEQSERRRPPQPKGLPALLAWFLLEWAAEVPRRVHGERDEIWRDRRRRGDPKDYLPVGGSALGSPALSSPFEAYIESTPFETDRDGNYARPMHAALRRLAGYDADRRMAELTDRPFMARYLFRLAVMGGDIDLVIASIGAPPQMARPYTEVALNELYRCWRSEPDMRVLASVVHTAPASRAADGLAANADTADVRDRP